MKSRTSMLIRSIPWAIATGTLASAAAAAPTFRITVIDSLPADEVCRPTDINDLGHVALDCSQRAFFWTPEDGVVEIPAPGADRYVSSAALNNHDVVAAKVQSFDGTIREGVLARWWGFGAVAATTVTRVGTPPSTGIPGPP